MNSYGSEGPRKGPRNMLDPPTTGLGALPWMRTTMESILERMVPMVPIPTPDEIPAQSQGERPVSGSSARDRSGRTRLDEESEETLPAKKRRRQTSEDSAGFHRDPRSMSPVTLKSNDGFWWVVDGHRFVSSRRTFKRRTVSSISLQTPSPLPPPAISPTPVVDTPTASYSPTEVGNTPSPSTFIPPPRPPLWPPPRQPYREVSSPTEMPTPTRCPTSPINISDDDQEVKVVLKQTPKYMPRRTTTTIPHPDQEYDWIRLRTPGTIKVRKVMAPHQGETIDHYFERLERNWEPDPDREGLLRKRTQATPTLDWPTTVARCREFVMETKPLVTWPTLGWFSRHPQSAQSRQGERPASWHQVAQLETDRAEHTLARQLQQKRRRGSHPHRRNTGEPTVATKTATDPIEIQMSSVPTLRNKVLQRSHHTGVQSLSVKDTHFEYGLKTFDSGVSGPN